MSASGEKIRSAIVVVALASFAGAVAWRLVSIHTGRYEVAVRNSYVFTRSVQALRGAVMSRATSDTRPGYTYATSVPIWEYHADPASVNLNRHSREHVVTNVALALGLPEARVREAFSNWRSRYVPLGTSDSDDANRLMTNRKLVSGVSVEEKQVRRYPQGRHLANVLGFVTKDPTNSVGGAGLEMRYESWLKGVPGLIRGAKDAHGNEIRERRIVTKNPERGQTVHLTIDHTVQCDVERELREGLAACQAQAGWAIVLEAETGAVLAMASLPDYEPADFNHATKEMQRNRAIGENLEPGSVMKTITACAVLNEGLVTPDTMMNTSQFEEGYYKLPGDHGHKWEPLMSVRDGLVHSSNIVYGKLGVKLGPAKLWRYFKAFGFGRKSGIDLPGEEIGILPPPKKWDKTSWSRAPIGQFVSVTPMQMAAAYGAVANGGRLMRPYVVDHITDARGETTYRRLPEEVGRPITAETARRVRQMMLGVAKKGGTARRAAVKGYTVAGKTGTAQISLPGWRGYTPGEYNGSFIGIVPASSPKLVILVTYHRPRYCSSWDRSKSEGIPLFNHQGGVCAAPVFSRIAASVLAYLEIEPDAPEELGDS